MVNCLGKSQIIDRYKYKVRKKTHKIQETHHVLSIVGFFTFGENIMNKKQTINYKSSLTGADPVYALASCEVMDSLHTAKEALIQFGVISDYDKTSPESIQIANGKLIVKMVEILIKHVDSNE